MKSKLLISIALFSLLSSSHAIACSTSLKNSSGSKSSGDNHYIGEYEYISSANELRLTNSWNDNDANITLKPDDFLYSEQGWSHFILFTKHQPPSTPPGSGGGGIPPGGGGIVQNQFADMLSLKANTNNAKCDDIADLGKLTVSGNPMMANWLGGASSAWAIIASYNSGGIRVPRPPSPPDPPDWDAGEDEIDNTADLREQLMEDSLENGPLEHGGLFWPDGNGGYELLEYRVDIPGGSNQACRIIPPPVSSFTALGEWPEEVIFFHTHPYTPGDAACGGIISAGASTSDRDHLGWLRNNFSDSVEGMVMDEITIYRYGETANEDEPSVRRCK